MLVLKTTTGVTVELVDFFQIKDRGIVFTGTITELPDGQRTIASADLYNLILDQTLFDRKIKGLELFATMQQQVGRSIGLLLEPKAAGI